MDEEMTLRRAATAGAVCIAFFGMGSTSAGTVASQAYARPSSAPEVIGAATAFGEKVDLMSGVTEFHFVDVSIPANHKIPVQFGRRLQISKDQWEHSSYYDNWANVTYGYERAKEILGRYWELDVPYMKGTFDQRKGWLVGTTTARCSSGSFAPPTVMGQYPFYSEPFEPRKYWSGISINIPGAGQQGLLQSPSGATPTDGIQYVGVTTGNWRVACLPTLKQGQGEGFSVLLPNGIRYYFDWMAGKRRPSIMSGGTTGFGNGFNSGSDTISPQVLVPLEEIYIFATRAEDRFGNWVEYDFDAVNPMRLNAIRSSDGSIISVGYNAVGQINTVASAGRTWTYTYDSNDALIQVKLPDQSGWTYSINGLDMLFADREADVFNLHKLCEVNLGNMTSAATPDSADIGSLTITAPSGAIGEFKFRELVHGSARTPGTCRIERVYSYGNPPSYVDIAVLDGAPLLNRVAALYQKSISGPGLPGYQWAYSYANSWSYLSDCPDSGGCNVEAETIVTSPDGSRDRYLFGNDYAVNQGHMLRHTKEATGAALSTRSNVYIGSATGQPFPDQIGTNPNQLSNPLHTKNRPLKQSNVVQQSATFTRTVDTYDALARPLGVTNASTLGFSRTETTTYHDDFDDWVIGQTRKQLINSTVVSETLYDSLARPTHQYAFGKLRHTRSYYADGNLHSDKDGRNNITTLSSWYRGVPRLIQYPDGTSASAVVNPAGTIGSITDETGAKTCYGYDVMERLIQVTHPSETSAGVCDASAWNKTTQAFAQIGTSEYGIGAGHWRQIVYFGDYRRYTYFDALWRPLLTQEFDIGDQPATRRFTRNAYDYAGRATFASYPSTSSSPTAGVTTGYDALGRTTSVSQSSELGPLTTNTSYPTSAFQTIVTNPRGHQTRTTIYQAYDQPSYDLPRGINHPENAYTEIHRDVFGKPVWIKRRNSDSSDVAIRNYYYDAHQQLCKQVEPEIGATLMGYDAAGNLHWSASGLPSSTACSSLGNSAAILARKSVRTYDARNRPISLSFPDGLGDTVTSYTPDGLPESIAAYNGTNLVTTFYSYNRRRLLEEERMQWNTIDWPIKYTYNANGHLSQLTSVNVPLSYAPNALGQPTQVGAYATGVSYHPNGAIKQFTFGNGLVHRMEQNARQLPMVRCDSYGGSCGGAGVTAHLYDNYEYDQSGNVAAISDGATGRNHRGDRDMTYDGLDRLKTVLSPTYDAIPDKTARYAYDALDNLVAVKAPGRNHQYLYADGTNRLTNIVDAVTGATVTGLGYDEQGNLQEKNQIDYVFDYGNRLRSAHTGSSNSYYVYDGLGRRVRDNVAGAKYSLYSRAGQLLFEHDNRTNRQKWHVYLGGRLIATRDKDRATGVSSYHYQHTDALGSVLAVTDANRTPLELREYEPYGRQLVPATLKDGPGYTGHLQDAATGLTYMQQRYYDPGIGMFLSVDPVTAYSNPVGQFHRYRYANNNPYKFTDPDGRQSFVMPMGLPVDPTRMIDSRAIQSGSTVTASDTLVIRGRGWTRPAEHPYVVGRPGTPVPPGPSKGAGKVLDDNAPALHTMATYHDAFVEVATSNGVPDAVANIPSMPAAFALAVGAETVNSAVDIVNDVAGANIAMPFEHSHEQNLQQQIEQPPEAVVEVRRN